MAKYYISTPIYYVNDKAHIGHAYTTVASDVLARYHRIQGYDVLFTTGTDENSQKNVKAAESSGMGVGEYVDKMAAVWKDLYDKLNISYSQFIRTTEDRHKEAVYAMFEKLQASGDIYKGVYKGLYCAGCEDFVRESELVDGICPEHDKPPEELEENNYFFALSKYQKPLLDYISQNPEFIQPESRRHEVVAFTERGLEDFSITRETQEWGMPFPFDKDQAIYVWAEALINYLTVTGYPHAGYEQWWPADVHMVGKGIIKFHCIYWPAMLMSAELDLPKQVFAHGHLDLVGKKISKSTGNTIDPLDMVDRYGVDAARYLLLRDTPFGQDGNISLERFEAVYNSELADDLGNLVSRVTAMIQKYQGGMLGVGGDPAHDTTPYHEAFQELRLDKALDVVSTFTKGLNLYIEEEKPWVIARTNAEHLEEVLSYLATNLRHLAELLAPFMPEAADKIETAFEGRALQPIEGTLFPKNHAAD